MQHFAGYPDTALDLVAAIGAGDRDFFHAAHDRYREDILEPTRALVRDLAPSLPAISAGLRAVPSVNGSIAPVANDARFHPAAPYKDHVLLRFREEGATVHSPALLLRIGPAGIAFGAAWRPGPGALARYREAVAGPAGAVLSDVMADFLRRPRAALAGDQVRRVPAGFPADHERQDLLRRTRLIAHWQEPVPRAVHSARFVPWCARRLYACGDLYTWLRHQVG